MFLKLFILVKEPKPGFRQNCSLPEYRVKFGINFPQGEYKDFQRGAQKSGLGNSYKWPIKFEPSQLTANKLTANQRFCYSDFVTDFVAVISPQNEGLGKMALGIVKIYLGSPFSPLSVVCGQLVRDQLLWTP